MAGFWSGLLLVPMSWELEGAREGETWTGGRPDPPMEDSPGGGVEGMEEKEPDAQDVDAWERAGPNAGPELDAMGGTDGRAGGTKGEERVPFCGPRWSATPSIPF